MTKVTVSWHYSWFPPQADRSQCLQVLLEALGVNQAFLSQLPPHLHLPVAVTCYWFQKAQPTPDVGLLKALLLGLSNGDALRKRTGIKSTNTSRGFTLGPLTSGLFPFLLIKFPASYILYQCTLLPTQQLDLWMKCVCNVVCCSCAESTQ